MFKRIALAALSAIVASTSAGAQNAIKIGLVAPLISKSERKYAVQSAFANLSRDRSEQR